MPDIQQQNASTERLSRLRLYLWQRPVTLALLTGLAVLFFLFVTGISRSIEISRNHWGTGGSSVVWLI